MTAVTDEAQTRNDADVTAQLEAVEGKTATITLIGGDETKGKIKQAGDKDGERRFQVGRRIVSVSQVVRVVPVSEPGVPGEAGEAAPGDTPEERTANHREAVQAAAAKARGEQAENPVTTLTSGAVVTGKTLTIRCAWVAPEDRTKKQEELFDSGFAGVEKGKTYEAMVKAAGSGANKAKAMPDGSERVIKVQDAFQVRFTPENQKKHRNEVRRRKAAARRAAREAAAKA